MEAAALAVELLELYSPAYANTTDWAGEAAGSGKKGGGKKPVDADAPESWRVFLFALAGSAPAPARVAAMCRATPEFVGALPGAARQGLTLVHFSAQPEPFLTQNTR
jgi:U3 small nucleolar RNA-associated protein 10